MAQVFSGTVTVPTGAAKEMFVYTNTTQQNVRVVINYLAFTAGPINSGTNIAITGQPAPAGVYSSLRYGVRSSTVTGGSGSPFSGFLTSAILTTISIMGKSVTDSTSRAPTELYLSAGQQFVIGGDGGTVTYNLLILTEN